MDDLVSKLARLADEELMDDSFGNAYTFGWVALFAGDSAILTEKLDNISVKVYPDYGSLMEAWRDAENQWNAYAEIHGTD